MVAATVENHYVTLLYLKKRLLEQKTGITEHYPTDFNKG